MITVIGNQLKCDDKIYQCAVGKNGFSLAKKEGDNCTPIGRFLLREVFYRADKIARPDTNLPVSEILEDDGWCDAPEDVNYNKKVKLHYPASHEKLWRDDDIYDLVVVIGYNDEPVVKAKGSAIFMHVARDNYAGTEGCIALKHKDLLQVIKSADANTIIDIQDGN